MLAVVAEADGEADELAWDDSLERSMAPREVGAKGSCALEG